MKTCPKCRIEKSLDNFYINKIKWVPYIRTYCKKCYLANLKKKNRI